MIDVLRSTIRALGFTNRAIEQKLGVSRGYLTRLFSGVMDLRFDHIAEISEAMGVDPEEVLRLAFPPTQKPVGTAETRLRDALGVPSFQEVGASTVIVQESPLEKELERMVEKTLRKMFVGRETGA
jgi:transcriptional regulator with XRE-family HTH domain